MNCGQQLRDLLAPLGVYRWDGSFQWGELQSEGEALDGIAAELARIQREMHLATAREEGLTGLQALLTCYAGARTPEELRLAMAALLRVGSDSFTLAAVNDALGGCGVPALVEETGDPLRLVVSFPDVGGVPADFAQMRKTIEALLPCHVLVSFRFRTLSWEDMERQYTSWDEIENAGLTWKAFEGQSI